MKLIKFINKNYNNNSDLFKNLKQNQCAALRYKYIFFDVTNFEKCEIPTFKAIFKSRYLMFNNKTINFKNLFTDFFEIELIDNIKEEYLNDNNNILVSYFQLLFDKIYYVDFYQNLNLKNNIKN